MLLKYNNEVIVLRYFTPLIKNELEMWGEVSLSASTQGPPHYSSHLWFNLTVSQSEGGVEVTSHIV